MTTSPGQRSAVRALVNDEPPIAGAASQTVEWLQRLCRAAVRALPASGAGVSLMSAGASHGVIAASDHTSQLIDELQFTLGQGPCVDAYAERRPVLASRLDTEAATQWPAYASAAYDHGVRAVFAFPLQIGSACMGVFDVYRTDPGVLSQEAYDQAQSFAEVALLSLLEHQQNAGNSQSGAQRGEDLGGRAEVHQAQGMLMVQLGSDLEGAMLRLRAHAYAHDRRLSEVARDVLNGKLKLEKDI